MGGEIAAVLIPSFGVSRTFETTVAVLWRAMTDAEALARWYMPPEARVLASEMNLQPGGAYRYGLAFPDGAQMWGQWRIERVDPAECLRFVQHFSDAEGGVTRNPHDPEWPRLIRAVIRTARQGDGATVTVNWTPEEASEAECAAFRAGMSAMSTGWELTLDRLDAYLSRPRACA
jgi:uncharacterized protein YndB with AHSA1/START domain